MRVLLLTLVLVLAGRLAAPSAAAAQYPQAYHRLTDAIVVGSSVTSAGSGSELLGGGPELGGFVELPIGDELRLRSEAGAGFWRYRGEPYSGLQASGMRRYRVTASVIRSPYALSPARRFAPYSGGGGGVYFYRFPYRSGSGAWGIHGIVGGEYLLRTVRSRWIVGGEIQVHALGGPTRSGGTSITMLAGHATMLVKYRLP